MIPNLAGKRSSARRGMRMAAIGIAAVIGLMVFAFFGSTPAVAQSPQTAVAPSPAAGSARSAPMSTLPTSASFEVAWIKPNHSGDRRFFVSWQPGRFNATGERLTLKFLITMAYDVKDFQVSGGPGWVNTDRYDIDAKEPNSIARELDKDPLDQRRSLADSMLQSLLADRFQLKLTHGTKDMPAYALVVAKSGAKLQEAKPVETQAEAPSGPGDHPHGPMIRMGRGEVSGQGVAASFLASVLSQQLGRTVLDKTGLKGKYDFTLKWTPEQGEGMVLGGPGGPGGGPPPGGGPAPDGAPPPDASGPSIFTALQEQLGLRLEATKAPAEVLVIVHVEKPSEN